MKPAKKHGKDSATQKTNPRDWKDDEVNYIFSLIKSRGNQSVPKDIVGTYIEYQAKDAAADGEKNIARILFKIVPLINQNRWDSAEKLAGTLVPCEQREMDIDTQGT